MDHPSLFQQQFFISSLLEEKVSNGVAEALRLRIARAYRDKQNFRVIVVMPLLPSYPAGTCSRNFEQWMMGGREGGGWRERGGEGRGLG